MGVFCTRGINTLKRHRCHFTAGPPMSDSQHGSICFPLVFSRSWMNLHSSAVIASRAECWRAATRILTLLGRIGASSLKSFSCGYAFTMKRSRRSEEATQLLMWKPPSHRGRKQCKTAPTWRRNPKRPQGLDGKRRTVNFMNWRKCCRYRRPSPPNWIKPL